MPSFGRYEILDKLGEGAMGVVFRARDQHLGRVVALKMLSAEMGGDEELQRRFEREAEAIGRLSHRNIVAVYDVGEADSQFYMAMELLEGEDLRGLIERHADLPLAERVRILAEVAEGLAYAHSRGVVHRDIKPANIMVTKEGHAKILDFGLARVNARATITKQGVILGTPDYMSPEQATGRSLDHRTDVFSAGAVFYEFLALQKPFKGRTLHSVLYQIISEQPTPVLSLNPDVPARLAAIVHRMLAKLADRRYASMEDVARDLRQVHFALRRSRGRSALWPPAPPPPVPNDDPPRRMRDCVSRARGDADAGRFAKATIELEEALALDPEFEEASELLWRVTRKQQGRRGALDPIDAQGAARINILLARAAPGQPEEEARQALAELALIAPDDPRVMDAFRLRNRQGDEDLID